MRDRELVVELALRARVPEEAVRAVLAALSEVLRAGELSEADLRSAGHDPAPAGAADLEALKVSAPTDPRVVDDLISCARSHPLGIEFLERGYLGSVAVEFHSHAFTVEAARERLHAPGPKGPGEEGPG